MGSDKAMLRLRPGGPTFLELAVAAANAVSDDVLIIASDRPEYAEVGASVRPDRFPRDGPLGGIATALIEARHDAVVVISCDHPFLNAALLARLGRIDPEIDACLPRVAGSSRQGGEFTLQTLHAAYRSRCLTFIERSLRSGNRQIVGFLADVRVEHLDEAEMRRFDPSLRSLISVNTPEAFAAARAIADAHAI